MPEAIIPIDPQPRALLRPQEQQRRDAHGDGQPAQGVEVRGEVEDERDGEQRLDDGEDRDFAAGDRLFSGNKAHIPVGWWRVSLTTRSPSQQGNKIRDGNNRNAAGFRQR